MYEGPCVNVKVELGSSFIFTSNLPYMTSILFAQVKFQAYARKNYVTVEIQQSFCPSCHQLCCSLPYWITCIDCEHWIYINKKETSLSKCQWVCKLLLHTWKLLKNMTNKILLLLITETFFFVLWGIWDKNKEKRLWTKKADIKLLLKLKLIFTVLFRGNEISLQIKFTARGWVLLLDSKGVNSLPLNLTSESNAVCFYFSSRKQELN